MGPKVACPPARAMTARQAQQLQALHGTAGEHAGAKVATTRAASDRNRCQGKRKLNQRSVAGLQSMAAAATTVVSCPTLWTRTRATSLAWLLPPNSGCQLSLRGAAAAW